MALSESKKLVLIGPVLNASVDSGVLSRFNLINVPQIAVDGGIQFSQNPRLWVGDGDSSGVLSGDVPAVNKNAQDETDLHFCLKQIESWSWDELHLFGFLGGRRDHEWAGRRRAAARGGGRRDAGAPRRAQTARTPPRAGRSHGSERAVAG